MLRNNFPLELNIELVPSGSSLLSQRANWRGFEQSSLFLVIFSSSRIHNNSGIILKVYLYEAVFGVPHCPIVPCEIVLSLLCLSCVGRKQSPTHERISFYGVCVLNTELQEVEFRCLAVHVGSPHGNFHLKFTIIMTLGGPPPRPTVIHPLSPPAVPYITHLLTTKET